ncbi:MAG: hypothetical protein AAGH15_10760 [Myxococcota bacterium]
MILMKRALPRLPAVALVLGGGCGDGSDADLVTRSCEVFERCDPNFSAVYADQAECVTEGRQALDELEMNDPDCFAASVAYYECYVSVRADTCAPSESACLTEYVQYVENCDFGYY